MKRVQFSRRVGGFTLLELMIVVAIIGILTMIAVPSYNRYAFRARRADAQTALMQIATAQERYYATYNTYASSPVNDLKMTSTTTPNGYYTLSIGTMPGTDLTTAYVATATAIGGQANDVCLNLTIDSRGTKSQTGQDNVNGMCW
ncbi:type IV pilus assembly protein PilE [Luteibacter sp. Sphag1AF]|uniref:type IV pilin protein n=1 Tax=Luteibacter sp. Sphag1AF TaxID=2587031 RepID=UPI00161111A9|nr:type IV pilin protein [Luteibacter sp. Sphag1AF]MBB3229131.1 type IV pilus assembly protein PilE [Luteibacter sp. Sphag1AF]